LRCPIFSMQSYGIEARTTQLYGGAERPGDVRLAPTGVKRRRVPDEYKSIMQKHGVFSIW